MFYDKSCIITALQHSCLSTAEGHSLILKFDPGFEAFEFSFSNIQQTSLVSLRLTHSRTLLRQFNTILSKFII